MGNEQIKSKREGTYQLIVTQLKDNPAYLLLFRHGLSGVVLLEVSKSSNLNECKLKDVWHAYTREKKLNQEK